MPWKETGPMNERMQFIGQWLSEDYTISELARGYGVSRKTAYKWIERYRSEGPEGLREKSRAAKYHPNQTPSELVADIVKEKKAHRRWGPKKIAARLRKNYPEKEWPAVSTVGNWLKKNGLVEPRKRRRQVPPYQEALISCDAANQLWSADYKGEFRMGDSKYCYPLTISDNYSRYLLACEGLYGPRYQESQEVFEKVFREYGLPEAIRTDNGTPFAGNGKTGLSRLSVWWIKLGIHPERIRKGCPQENGRHERMHQTLKAATTKPPGGDMEQQQEFFDEFCLEYNEERPHEGLDMNVPTSKYSNSNRPYPKQIPPVDYDLEYTVRSVRSNGEIKYGGEMYYLSDVLAGEKVGLKEKEDGQQVIFFSYLPVAILDLRAKKIEIYKGEDK